MEYIIQKHDGAIFVDFIGDFDTFEEAKSWAVLNMEVAAFDDSYGETWRIVMSNAKHEPPVGTFASVARMMSDIDPSFDWDAWKDDMKEGRYND